MKQNELRKKLFSKKDDNKSIFSRQLKISEEYNILGIKIPELEKMAKLMSCQYVLDFFEFDKSNLFYEEVILAYMVFARTMKDRETIDNLSLLSKLLKYNNSWATNDLLVSRIKIIKKKQEDYHSYIVDKLNSSEPYDIRFAIICLMNYYLDDNYIDITLFSIKNVTIDHYYVRMAKAWALATSLAKQREKTKPCFSLDYCDNETLKMAISKAIDSYRISKEDKKELKLLRATL